jgi:integrase/recombinase XerD
LTHPNVVGFDPLRDSRHRAARASREVADWLAYLALEGKAPRTLDDYERTAAVLLRMFPALELREMTDSEVAHALATFPAKSRRIRRAHLSSLFAWARLTRRVDGNPMELVPKQKRNPRRHVDTFTDAECALLEALPAPDGPLLSFMLRAGLRKGDCRRLLCRHVNLDRGHLVVHGSKGGKDRVVPIRSLAHVLSEWFLLDGIRPNDHLWYTKPGGGRLQRRATPGEGSFHRWWVGCLDMAGVTYRNPHVTRHTFAVNWLRHGGRLETLSDAMGHSSIATTDDEYGGITLEDIAADLELVES